MKKFLIFGTISSILAGCGGYKNVNWYGEQPEGATSTPSDVQSNYINSTALYGSENGGRISNIAVLLPVNGDAAIEGKNIKTAIETAILQKPKSNIKVSFYDLSGDEYNRETVIKEALSYDPDVVIGPLFSNDVQTIHDLKPYNLPVISFTSDISTLGDGVMTINLIPTQSIETIVKQMKTDNRTEMLILAPNTSSGKLMASVAYEASDIYNIPVNGLYYYESAQSDSIKDTALKASMYNTRNAANTRAREVLSDILTKETLSDNDKESLNNQLEKISKTETLGKLPYDAILFLGNGEDSKTLASFLRYYGVSANDAKLYGTTLWHGSDIYSDITMSGAKYATLPDISEQFVNTYNSVAGENPDNLSAFGYDATNLALGMLFTPQSQAAYLLDPSGYVGANGIFRIQPNGESERGLRIMGLNASGIPKLLKEAPTNFLIPLYNVKTNDIDSISEQELSTPGINPGDYIDIPKQLQKKNAYKTKTIGTNIKEPTADIINTEPLQVYSSEESEIISNPEYKPVKLESVSRKYIDSVEVLE